MAKFKFAILWASIANDAIAGSLFKRKPETQPQTDEHQESSVRFIFIFQWHGKMSTSAGIQEFKDLVNRAIATCKQIIASTPEIDVTFDRLDQP